MATATIKAGENALIKIGLFVIPDGTTYKGVWDSGTAYVEDDVVVYLDVAYRCILAHTNHQPPNIVYWDPLDPILASNVKALFVALVGTDHITPVVQWIYVQGAPSPANLVLTDGLLKLELLVADSGQLVTPDKLAIAFPEITDPEPPYTYHLKYLVELVNTDFLTGQQCDVVCLEDFLEVSPC